MIFGFIKKLVKYYIDKLIHWMRMTKFNLELDNDIKKYHEELDKKAKKLSVPASLPIVALPPKETAEPFNVILELASLEFAILPANISLVTVAVPGV